MGSDLLSVCVFCATALLGTDLAPFPGTIGVARAEPGQYSSVPPGRYAGNIDVRDLTEGAALYVPVFVKGALLWTGDSHAAQGNGRSTSLRSRLPIGK